MRSFNYCRVLLFLVVIFTSSISFAEDYSWTLSQHVGPSPQAVCQLWANSNYPSHVSATISDIDGPTAKCTVKVPWNDLFDYFVGWAARSGDSCPPDSVYDPARGLCVSSASNGDWCDRDTNPVVKGIVSGGVCVPTHEAALPDKCKAYSKSEDNSQEVIRTWKYPDNPNSDLRNPATASNSIGCEVQLIEDLSCKTYPPHVNPGVQQADGTMTEPFYVAKEIECSTRAKLTGNVAPTPAGDPEGTFCDPGVDSCSITPPEQVVESKPCTYVTDSEGRQTCTSWDFKGKEGAEQCGTVDGVFACRDDLPKATGQGLSIGTVVETTDTGDGKTKVTKTDTAKKTVCIGADSCTTTTTTNKTTTVVNNGTGQVESVSGACTGALCESSTNPDGNGDGLGDCTIDCGDEEEGGGPHDWYQPGEDTYASVIEDFTGRVSSMPAVAGVDNFLTFTPSGTCPVYTVDVWIFYFQIDQFCSGEIPWDLIRAIILGCCAFLAFRIAFL